MTTATNGTVMNGAAGTRARGRKPRAKAAPEGAPKPDHTLTDKESGVTARVYVGDCREIIPRVPECAKGEVDLVFADPPFNWNRAYDEWHDAMPREDYLGFTEQWLDACIKSLAPHGSMWVNIPDDTAAEIVVHLKKRGLHMINWCVWHYRFGQNTTGRFINSKVHALYFARQRDPLPSAKTAGIRGLSGGGGAAAQGRVWNPDEILEPSDRATTYFDPRTQQKNDGMPPGMRLPMDVWYGQYWGRIQGNNKERRANHDNQLPEVYLERVVRACSNEGQLVMDPFLGSGTTGVVAHALGRRFIGCEYSAANAKSAVDRMKAGPIRLGQALNQSTAIFPARRRRPSAAPKEG